MSSIRILSDRVANQIAAGEVIERPVAVVKELVENSIDAGATRIEVEFRNGGKSYIRVEDNGHGMSADDALLSLERHATSKIREVDDLLTIGTFGFRGEALPSIASVSRFTMSTRTAESEHGTEVLVNGGKLIHAKECGMAVGTRIEVAHLFNSVPARRKFLKTENTEAAHIVHLCRLCAVANPETSFTLIENGRTLFRSPVCPSLQERIQEIFGKQIAGNLMEIEAEEEGYRLSGLIGKPGVGRSTRQELVTYVNRRPVDSRLLNFALIEAYHTYIPKGRYPLAFVFLDLDARGVDVNVHPAKREVRFRDEGRIRQFVIRAVLDALRAAARPVEAVRAALPAPAPVISRPSDAAPVSSDGPVRSQARAATPEPEVSSKKEIQPAPESQAVPKAGKKAEPEAPPKPRLGWKFLNILHRNYALFETESGLIVLNLRGAQERILYEDIKGRLEQARAVSQKLLFPVSLELDSMSATVMDEHLEFFRENGFEVEPFGRNFYRLEALPNWLDPAVGEGFVRDLLALIRERGLHPDSPDLAHEEMARLAAASASRAEKGHSEAEMTSLAGRLMACQNPHNDPRGRPTYTEVTRGELEKKFGR